MTSSSYQNDEIDLLELFAKFILILKRNSLIIGLAFIIGTLLGLAYYQFVPKTFSSKIIITSDILTESHSKNLFKNLMRSLSEGDVDLVARKLNLPKEEVKQIGSLKIENAADKPDAPLDDEKKIFLQIEATSNQNTIWPNLEKGILFFLDNNDFSKIKIAQRKRLYTEMIQKLNQEISDLEKLKIQLFTDKSLFNKSGTLLIDPTTINTKIIELNREKLVYENKLETVSSAQLAEGFTIYKNPSSPKLSISLAAGASFGLFFVAIIIAFKAIRSMLRFSEEKLGQA
jgi:Chain length determinant protein